MNSENATVCIVDDDPSVRKALVRAVQTAGLRAKPFASAREFLDQPPPEGPVCLVLDILLPGLNGLELQVELNSRNIEIPIIFITGHGTVPMSVKAMKRGALDFLTKPFKVANLLGLIQEALHKDASRQIARAATADLQRRCQALTPREREVLDLVVKGLSNKQIASELGAAERTIKVHRGRVMKKMQVVSVADLVRAVEQLKLERDRPPS